MAAACVYSLGKYSQSISLCNRAINLLGLCGLSGGTLKHTIQSTQAEAHRLKTEYLEAYNIQAQIFYESSLNLDPYHQGVTALSVAQLQISMDAPKQEVQKNIDTGKSLIREDRLLQWCEVLQGDLNLREGYSVDADIILCNTLQVSWGNAADIVAYCLEILADVARWSDFRGVSLWPTVLLVHSLKSRERLGIHKAIQFLGNLFLAQDDKDTAISLFTVALEGFTYIDVHRSRAECMLHLGDISKGCGDLLKAVELWEAARLLFERSSQAKQVEDIDERLAIVGEDVWKQHRANLAHLVKHNGPSGIVGEVDDEELKVLNLDDPKVELIAV
jgi:tetratricopeptide (TPR) repeat protein